MNTPILYSLEWWQVLVAGIGTLAIFSFLYKENPVYRLFEHFFIGIAAAYGVVTTFQEVLWPRVFEPMFGLDRAVFPDGTYSEPYNKLLLLYLLPISFGLCYYFILSRKWNWIAQVVIGFTFGVSAGLGFKGIFVEFVPQLVKSFRPLYVPGDTLQTFSNLVFVVILVTAMSYFFFTFKRRKGGIAERSAVTGRWMLMGCFGAFFGSTITARMALLIERMQFLIREWYPLLETAYRDLSQRFLGGVL